MEARTEVHPVDATPVTLEDLRRLRYEMRRAAKLRLVARNEQYTGHYA